MALSHRRERGGCPTGTSGEDLAGEEDRDEARVRRCVVGAVRASAMCPTTSQGAEEGSTGLGLERAATTNLQKSPTV